ncbi:MAG: movement protein [Taraxacum cytorhabdovirus 1]|uniref:Movement protein n=1 Tax=Taraxacum cytorhabdovirus 1 TaxID=2950880 RepID=A0AAE9MSJ8_9RHAB|nr:MAG: movement protein [Taraxacum cytorhabdovirus 1]
MSSGIISVNDARLAIEQNGSLTALIGSNTVYDQKHASYARKKEVNVKVVSSDNQDLLIRNMPLFDDNDVKEMVNQTGEFKYVHIGCITVSIEPLIHQRFMSAFGKSIKGVCVIFDSTFEVFEESIICAHKFDLSEGRADFVCYPNHCLSATDSNLCERLSVLLCMDNIKVKKGNEMLTVCIGHVTSGTNTLNPGGHTPGPMRTVGVKGTAEVDISTMGNEVIHRLESARDKGLLDIVPTGGDLYIRPKRHGVKKYFMKQPKVVVRKNYNTSVAEGGVRQSGPDSGFEAPRRSFSAPSSPQSSNRSTRPTSSGSVRTGNKYYIDGDLIRGAVKAKKDNLRSISARYNKLQLGT